MPDESAQHWEQQQVLEALMGIGPDRLHAHFLQAYEMMIYALIIAHEMHERERKASKRVEGDRPLDPNTLTGTPLRKAANSPSLYFLLALLKFGPQPQDSEGTGLPGDFILPNDLAKALEEEVARDLQGDSARKAIYAALELAGLDAEFSKVRDALLMDGDVKRSRASIKKSFFDPIASLAILGLIETQIGSRGRAAPPVMVRLTVKGWKFLRQVFLHSVEASAQIYASRNDPEKDA